MKPCQHCGQALENGASLCAACGTEWKSSVRVTVTKPAEGKRAYVYTPLPANWRRILWMLRLGLPAAALIVARVYSSSFGGAITALILTAVLIVFLLSDPFFIGGLLFAPILGLYGLKFVDRKEPEMDLREPDVQLFLFFAIPVALAIAGLVALKF